MFRAVVRYGRLRHLAEFTPEDEATPAPTPKNPCVVHTERGDELGVVLALATGPEIPGKPRRAYVRAATAEDVTQGQSAELASESARTFAQARAQQRGLALRVVGVEKLFSGDRSILYYTAEDRLDLRELSRDVQAHLGTRVELRQLGARERARMCGGTGVCGRALCCSSFLRELEPVTLRMAKVQGFSLSPDATQGACGRLKCCLRYENPLYEEARGLMPRIGAWVEAARASGEVVGLSVLARKVTISTADGRLVDLFAAEVAAARTLPRRLPLAPVALPTTPAGATSTSTTPTPAPGTVTPQSPEKTTGSSVSERLRGITRRLLGRRERSAESDRLEKKPDEPLAGHQPEEDDP